MENNFTKLQKLALHTVAKKIIRLEKLYQQDEITLEEWYYEIATALDDVEFQRPKF